MTKADNSIQQIIPYSQSIQNTQTKGNSQQISELLKGYALLPKILGVMFSILRLWRYHITKAHVDKAQYHQNKIEQWWRKLHLSITPKIHLLLHQAIVFLIYIEGFGNLGEDAGEQAHQSECQNDCRVAAVKETLKKETSKAKFKSMSKNFEVVKKIANMITRTKRKKELRKSQLMLWPKNLVKMMTNI